MPQPWHSKVIQGSFSRPHHGMAFARPGLAIHEDGAVVSREHILHNLPQAGLGQARGGGVWKCLGVSWSPTAPSRPGPQGVHTPTRPSEPSNHVPHRPLGVRSGCLGCLPTPPPGGGLAASQNPARSTARCTQRPPAAAPPPGTRGRTQTGDCPGCPPR